MTTLLNIVLLVIGSAATLAAFGGKTWNEGNEPVLRRITLRGWLSLICLVLALLVGTFKEVLTRREDARKERTTSEEKITLTSQLAATRTELTLATRQLDDLRTIDKLTQERLVETKSTLENVRGNLVKTHDELDRQGDVSLLTALSNANQHVRDVQFFIPFTEKGTEASTFYDALLPPLSSKVCGSQTETAIGVYLGKGGLETMQYSRDDNKDSHAYFQNSPPKVDALFHPGGTGHQEDENEALNVRMTSMLIRQKTSNQHAIAIVIHVSDQRESAAHFLNPMQVTSGFPITVSASPYGENTEPSAEGKMPEFSAVCKTQLERYFATAFEKAYAGITLTENTNMTIYLRLKAMKPEWHFSGSILWLTFVPDSKPLVFVNDEFAGLLNVKWPDALKDTKH